MVAAYYLLEKTNSIPRDRLAEGHATTKMAYRSAQARDILSGKGHVKSWLVVQEILMALPDLLDACGVEDVGEIISLPGSESSSDAAA